MFGIGNALPRLQDLIPQEGKCLGQLMYFVNGRSLYLMRGSV